MAKSEEDAEQLVQAALKKLSGQTIVLDVMDDKLQLISFLQAVGFEK